MTTPVAYLNGQYLPVSQASLHVFDLGVVGGAAVTEMARTFHGVPFRLDQHLNRLVRSLDAVGFEIGLKIAELRSICETVVDQNWKLIPPTDDLGLIVFVTAGLNPTYVGRIDPSDRRPTVCVHTFSLPFELWADACAGVHLVTVKTRNIPEDVIDPRIKHRSRLHWHLAAKEARQIEPGATAILFDQKDGLTETAAGNLCVVDGSTIISPAAHVLDGISRDYVAELAALLGLGFARAQVTADDLAHADEAFLTSTPNCLLPVTRFNHQPVGTGQPGPVYRQLIQEWSKSVGVDILAQLTQRRS